MALFDPKPMTVRELGEIKARYERMCAFVEEDPSAGSTACAIAYSLDVPKLIEAVEYLSHKVWEFKEAAADASR